MSVSRRLAIAIAILLSLTAVPGCGNGSEAQRQAAASLGRRLGAYLPEEPAQAARLAVAADELHHSPDTELGLLATAAAQLGVERTIDTGAARVAAVARMRDVVVSAGTNGHLQVFSASTGSRLASYRTPGVIRSLAVSDKLGATVASSDARGRIALWDFTDPAHATHSLLATSGPPAVMLAFSPRGTTLLALDAAGQLKRFDVASRAPRRPLDLLDGRRGMVAAASLHENGDEPDFDLLVALRSGVVLRVHVPTLDRKTIVPAGRLSGRITTVVEEPFGPKVAIGTTSGLYVAGKGPGGPSRTAIAPVRALAYSNGHLLVGEAKGLLTVLGDTTETTKPEVSPGVTALASSAAGAVAGHDDGSVRLLGRSTTGLALPDGSDSAVVSFGPHGDLLLASGYDPNHVDSLVSVKPGASVAQADGSSGYRVVRRFRPAKSWWPQGESDSNHWFVGEAIYGHDFVVAGGQDPTGVAVALVWDAQTGRPIVRLPLRTAGVNTTEPQLASGLALLSGRKLLVAYSRVQESLIIWSTTSWRRLATVYVGPIAGLTVSPDEKTIIVSQQSHRESDTRSGIRRSSLQFVDVGRAKVTGQVPIPSAKDIDLSPSGQYLAVASEGSVRLLSADGKRGVAKPVDVEDADPKVVWRPDSNLLAVLRHDDTVLVDPWTGELSGSLPAPENTQPAGAAFRGDGGELAVTHYLDVSGTPTAPPPTIFTLGDSDLKRRACALVARNWTPGEWRTEVGHGIAFQRVCPAPGLPAHRRSGRPIPHPVIAYRERGRVWAANAQGRTQDLGPASDDAYANPTFSWSPSGALAWAANGRVWLLRRGHVTSWTCACAGVAFADETPEAVDADGTELLTFGSDGARGRQVVGLPHYSVRLLAVGRRRALIAGFSTSPDRATPSELYLVGPGRRAKRVATTRFGAVSGAAPVPSPNGAEAAFAVSASGGACYTQERVGVFNFDRPRARYPSPPAGTADSVLIRSLSWPSGGRLTATEARVNCPGTSGIQRSMPTWLLTLQGPRFAAEREVGYDLNIGGGIEAELTEPPDRYPPRGTLTLASGRRRIIVAHNAGFVSVRP